MIKNNQCLIDAFEAEVSLKGFLFFSWGIEKQHRAVMGNLK